ncbi:MAG: DUF2007 domain-containing protein [Endomicrobiales bacterium]|nr:DUF2007 domain-containing protein [Endomicrobiales bacterium]
MNDQELVEIFRSWSPFETGFIESLLESSNIQYFVQGKYYSSIVPAGSGAVPIRIMVAKKDEEAAKEIIEQYFRDQK